MSRNDYRKRKNQRLMRRLSRHLPTFFVLFILTALAGGGIFIASRFLLHRKSSSISPAVPAAALTSGSDDSVPHEEDSSSDAASEGTAALTDEISQFISQADRVAAGYDYDRAIQMIQGNEQAAADSRGQEAISRYETAKASLVEADPTQITHVFFHSLIMDTSRAFDGDADSKGYNSVMTTKDEFLKILEAMYEKGYVLVRIHDVAYEQTDENGNTSFVYGKIMLPEGKKPFVMSQDDLCYYDYMLDDGFASRIVIGDDGKPTCEMTLADGTVTRGSYDLVPILEDFIEEHPDFSYRGARAVLAFTGYQGILGYRTASSYSDSPTYEEDRRQAAEVAQCLRDNGWELASHSWGHLQLGVSADNPGAFAISDDRFITDTDKWEAEVESLIGPTDILLYPFGNDISDFHPYTSENPRFAYLMSKGFRYFCNVDASKPYWMQKGTDHFRMARRNLDGYRLYEDMVQTDPAKKHLSDLFDAADIFDSARPTPVTWY
ncbi:MAG TPA: polysaccharide deacetylase [Candidatus Enterocloster excrementigallinarum]|uniref:Polysaccharide deacetylase n=1 Tax=Candidatus Enterocloster excrementigallinarum TaxID=2838558 RepID=A0A9D2PV33_9FIRM|nr:polysaccharide deacetylase [Candidatus Enterocloster excrementigallinarum]